MFHFLLILDTLPMALLRLQIHFKLHWPFVISILQLFSLSLPQLAAHQCLFSSVFYLFCIGFLTAAYTFLSTLHLFKMLLVVSFAFAASNLSTS